MGTASLKLLTLAVYAGVGVRQGNTWTSVGQELLEFRPGLSEESHKAVSMFLWSQLTLRALTCNMASPLSLGAAGLEHLPPGMQPRNQIGSIRSSVTSTTLQLSWGGVESCSCHGDYLIAASQPSISHCGSRKEDRSFGLITRFLCNSKCVFPLAVPQFLNL